MTRAAFPPARWLLVEAAEPAPARDSPLVWWALGLLLSYVSAALVSIYVSRQPGNVATVWYANAVAVPFLTFRRPADWPWLLGSVALANLLANVVWGDGLLAAAAFVPANLLEVVLGAWLLQRTGLAAARLGSPRELLWLLLLAGVLPQLAGATAAATLVGPQGDTIWLPWFEGSVIGAVAVLPLAFLLCRDGWRAHREALLDPRMAVLLPLTLGVAVLALARLPFPFVYIAMPLLLAAMVVKMPALLVLTFAASLAAALALASGTFVPPPLRAAWEQVFVYLAMAAALVPAQLLASALAELRESHARLAARTLELRHANESLEQFVRIASHDMREPLNTVVQFGGLLEEEAAECLTAPGRRYLALMRQAASRMRVLLDDMLSYTRLQRGEALPLVPLALDEVFTELRLILSARLGDTGATLAVGPMPLVRGDSTMLLLLFQNLLSNALKFMPPGRTPEVEVSARCDAGVAWITVADNGIGIEPGDLGKLFQPFRRLQLRRLYEGTGLGLAMAKRIAEAHGGEISVTSVPGEGSRFTVRLALAPAEA